MAKSTDDILQEAQQAFWATLKANLPCPTDDIPSAAAIEFEQACTRAMMVWLQENLADGTAIKTADGYRFRKINGVFTDGDMSFEEGLAEIPSFVVIDETPGALNRPPAKP